MTEQQNPIFSESPFVYRFVEKDNRGPGNFEFSTGMQNKVQIYANSVKSPHSFDMSKEEEILVELEVQNLLAKGAVEFCSPDPNQFISNIFTIAKKDGLRGSVVDMRELNQFAEYLPFKMENRSQLKDILQRGD